MILSKPVGTSHLGGLRSQYKNHHFTLRRLLNINTSKFRLRSHYEVKVMVTFCETQK